MENQNETKKIILAIFYLCKPIRLPVPEKIIVYNEGVPKELDRNSEDFNKILKLTSKRFTRNLALATGVVTDEGMKVARSKGVGGGVNNFVYSKNHFMFCTNSFLYDRLYFYLAYNDDGFEVSLSGQYHGHPLGPLAYSQELIVLINNII